MGKILQFVLIAGFLSSSAYGFLTMDDFRQKIEPNCYDHKDGKELINGQVSPIPNSMEAFVSIVERLEEKYSMEKILRNLIGRFRFDDLLLRYTDGGNDYDFYTRGDENVKLIHQLLPYLLGETMNYDLRDSDLSEDEQCALYFMISHTVNDTVTPYMNLDDLGGSTILNNRDALNFPREQGVVNLNGKTHHAFALGKVLLGIFAGIQDSERTVAADSVFKQKSMKEPPEYLKDVQINVLHAVTMSDIIAVTVMNRLNVRDNGGINYLPNGYWDDSVCPTKYILTGNSDYYATRSLIRGAIDGLFLGQRIKEMRDNYPDIRLSQMLRMYYNPRVSSSDRSMSEAVWCNRHSFFSSYQSEIINQAVTYYQLYAALREQKANDLDPIKRQIGGVISVISSDTTALFDDMSGESDECGGTSGSGKTCETPRNVTVVMDSNREKDKQVQIIGNLSVGFHMSPSGSSMAVYSNLRYTDSTKLYSINQTDISGCASCAVKYHGYFDSVPSGVLNEVDVFHSLNRTLTRDDFPDESESEPGIPSKVILYFNYGAPQNTYDLRKAVHDFRYQHRSTQIFAIGPKKEFLSVFVKRPDYDVYSQDVTSTLKSLQERVCKVPAEFQYQNCYKNSISDENSHIFRGFVTPNHVQYWAMYPKYFLKSFNIQMTFTAVSGQIKVCFTRNYDEMFGNRQSTAGCSSADSGKEAVFTERNPCKKRNIDNCSPFYFSIEGTGVPGKKCTDKMCKTPNQIEFEFKHSGISCNSGISFAATPMTLAVAVVMSIYFVFKH